MHIGGNMKKLTKGLLAGLLVVPMAGIFTACDSTEPININDATVTLSYTEVEYDGTEKQPKVKITYQGEVIDSSEYEVKYYDNRNAGTASVVVFAARETQELVGRLELNFTINPGVSYVDTYGEMDSALRSSNYRAVVLQEDITIPYGATVTIANGKTVDFADYTLLNYGDIINNGTIHTKKNIGGKADRVVNNGDIIASVASKEALLEAFEYSNYVKLSQDIEKADGYLGDIRFDTVTEGRAAYEFVLDLNGHTLESELDLFSYVKNPNGSISSVNNTLDVTITDSSVGRTGCLGSNESDYGLYIWGQDNWNINIINATIKGRGGAIYTNGTAETSTVKINAIDSRFVATDSADSAGCYLTSNYTYEYTNCEFTGADGYYAKSGKHIFNNCSFFANGEYVAPTHHGSGFYGTGSGINIDSCNGGYQRVLTVELNGGFISSANGRGIYEFSTAANGVEKISYGTATLKGNVVFSTALSNVRSENDTVVTL